MKQAIKERSKAKMGGLGPSLMSFSSYTVTRTATLEKQMMSDPVSITPNSDVVVANDKGPLSVGLILSTVYPLCHWSLRGRDVVTRRSVKARRNVMI